MSKPDPVRIARHARSVVELVESSGIKGLDMARLLASRGYPTSTMGDGGSRGTDDWSSTERAACNPDPHWCGVDERLHLELRAWYDTGARLQATLTDVLAHAQHQGLRPTGTGAGECVACGEWCSGTANDRLRGGYCNACRVAYSRQGSPDRATFARDRRARLEPDDGEDIMERLNPGHGGHAA